MTERIPVAILGATGSVGQRFIQLLDQHPWLEVTAIYASERSSGVPYRQACRWVLSDPMPVWAREMPIQELNVTDIEPRLIFSALPASQALQVEADLARAGKVVCSNASTYRREADVPILLPEVNPDHIALTLRQKMRGWTGYIVTNPNCTSTGLTVALKALQDAFGLQRAFVVSLQALSGAGYPGVASLDLADNILPNIDGEEEKVEWEPRKMLGRISPDGIQPAAIAISAHTNRVAVTDGHTVCASVELGRQVSPEEAVEALVGYQAPLISRDLPSSPHPVILVRDEPDRPQPRLDRMTGGGMTTVMGRIRQDPLFHLKFVVLSHNTIRGAAGGSIYNAELLVNAGLV